MAGPYRDGKAVTTTRQSEPAAETAHARCYLSQGELPASPLAPFGIRFQALAGVVTAGLGRGGGRRAVPFVTSERRGDHAGSSAGEHLSLLTSEAQADTGGDAA
jgi:hypothetical protein